MATEKSAISILQEMAQIQRIPLPIYDVNSRGKEFHATLKLGNTKEIFSEATGRTKQLAKHLCAKNALQKLNNENAALAQDENENLTLKSLGLLGSSNKLSENHVGKLNELCSKIMVDVPNYNECGSENGEFIIECKMFDDTATRGQSRTKKDAKQKAAEQMLKVFIEKEKIRYKESMELREVACANINETTGKPSPLHESFENHVGKLNEICSKRHEIIPSYIDCGSKNDEFIIECKIFDNTITRGQAKTKKDAKQKAAKAMLSKIEESGSQKPTTCLSPYDEIINLYKSETDSYENYVGKLIEICVKEMLPTPIYMERVIENGEFAFDCEVLYKSVKNVTHGQSRSKKAAKEKAAEGMFQILSESLKLISQNLMKSVRITDTTSTIQQKPSTQKFAEHIETMSSQSDPSLVEHMNEEQLKMELRNLNVIYRITSLAEMGNMLTLETKPTRNCKSFTFMAIGQDKVQVHLELLRKTVVGVRILKTNLRS